MKIIDCNACIGYGGINRLIINHENYPVYEKVKQPKDAGELLAEMDFCGIDEAVVYHQSAFDVSPQCGNRQLLASEENYKGRLHGTLTILPSISDKGFDVDTILGQMKDYNLAGLRVFPAYNRFMLNRITCGDILDAATKLHIPLYLSPMKGWEYIFDTLGEFPELTVILSNYGLWGSDRYIYPLVNTYKNVYVDTSDFQELQGIEAFVNRFGSERLLFGTNYPMDNMGGPLTTIIAARISEKDRESIFHENIERLISGITLSEVK